MKKSDRIRDLVQQYASESNPVHDPRYTGYFACFNDQQYYEAHDVLEDLWLRETGKNHAYFKGLIQLAGAFVHLQKQANRPDHPKDGRRLRPAVRLFQLAIRNLEDFQPSHLDFDVQRALTLANGYISAIESSEFTRNPWDPAHAPQLNLA
jgi:predicted metal-dependent hydrolase